MKVLPKRTAFPILLNVSWDKVTAKAARSVFDENKVLLSWVLQELGHTPGSPFGPGWPFLPG